METKEAEVINTEYKRKKSWKEGVPMTERQRRAVVDTTEMSIGEGKKKEQ